MSIFIAGVEVLILFFFKKKILSVLHMYLFMHAGVPVCVCACIHDWMHIAAEAAFGAFFYCLPPYLFLFLNLELTAGARLPDQGTLGILPVP